MSPKPELLSPERLAEIQEDSEVALYWVGGQRYPTDDMAARAVNAVPELLADRAAFRQQVAAELAGLPSPYAESLDIEPAENLALTPAEWKRYNQIIHLAANRLGIPLP